MVTSIGELVELCSPQIQSGWRPLFSALRTVHGSKCDMKDYLIGAYSTGQSGFNVNSYTILILSVGCLPVCWYCSVFTTGTCFILDKSHAPVFDVFEAFINTDNIQVFANAATDYIMCLMKFVKGLGKVLFV